LLVGRDVVDVGKYVESGNELFVAPWVNVGGGSGEEVPGAGVAGVGEASS